MKIELEYTKAEAQEHISILFEGFGDGTTDWSEEDCMPAWNFLQAIQDAVKKSK